MAKQDKIDKMIHDMFRLCDEYVGISVFIEFEDKFSKVAKKAGYDLHKIYYGKTYQEMKAKYNRYKVLKTKKTKKIDSFKKVRAKKTKHGLRYVVFNSLPIEQQKAWNKQEDSRFTCPMPDEEHKGTICLHYHDYEKFYNAMIEGRIAVHLD